MAPRVPDSTYRLQLHRGFPLARARELVGLLDELGVGHLYSSPLFAAREGTTHGYDVVDPARVDPQLGGPEALAALSAALHGRGMGLLLDIVPNHMAAAEDNPWWWDVLRHGARSVHAAAFDIDWEAGGGRMVLPSLGGDPAELARAGELRVEARGGEHVLVYHEHSFPLDLGGAEPPRSPEALLELLERQPYRLVHWRDGARAINYRRFFDIDDLAALRSDDPEVFARGHALLLQLARCGQVDAVRVDHVDGLRDPQGYLELLRRSLDEAGREDACILVEKILSGDEELHPAWPVQGTTGYEFADALRDVFVDPRGFAALDRLYARVTGLERSFEDVDHDARSRVRDELFPADLERLAGRLERLCAAALERGTCTAQALREALAEVSVCLPVYRTYVRDEPVRDEDRAAIEQGLAEGRRRRPDLDESAWVLLREALLLEHGDRAGALEFVGRWQQLTSPLMAKGHEDTALYRYHRLVALNVVGGDPGVEPDGLPAFHRFLARRARRGRHGLNATATHDSKRGEDVRARLAVLSELADPWDRRVQRWREANAPLARAVGGLRVPSANAEYFLYQTLLGIWPPAAPGPGEREALAERLRAYAVKSAREAKQHTSWSEPDAAYEEALTGFLADVIAPGDPGRFLDDFEAFQRRVALHGMRNSLGHTLLKVVAPGVPDVYQGCELWDLSLVDPDNRRPVDFERRAALLARFAAVPGDEAAAFARGLLERWQSGEVKAWVLWRSLRFRRAFPALLRDGELLQVFAVGARAGRVCALALRDGRDWCLAAVPRLIAAALEEAGRDHPDAAFWSDSELRLPQGAPAAWRDVLTGAAHESRSNALPLADLFAHLPVALLHGQG